MSRTRSASILLLVPMAIGIAGCARTTVEHPLATNYPASDVSAELEFMSKLAQRPVITNDEGLHTLLTFADGSDTAGSYTARVERARERGWVRKSWDEKPDLAMQRGTLATALAIHCGIKGGVVMRVVGPTPRYASRELAYLGILSPGSEQQTMTGAEFVGILSKAQDFILLKQYEAQHKDRAKQGTAGSANSVGAAGASRSNGAAAISNN